MSIITKYVTKEFLKLLGWLLLVFICVYLIVDFSRIKGFLEHNALLADIVGYYLFKIPLILFQTLPVAVLIATVFTLGAMTKNSEITALKSCGINVFRVILPVLSAAFIISLFTFVFNEYIIPYTNKQVEHIKRVKIQKKKPRGVIESNDAWFRGEAGVFYNFEFINPQTDLLKKVVIYKFDDNFRLLYRIDAGELKWEKGKWYIKQAIMRTFTANGMKIEQIDIKPLPQIKETPNSFKELNKDPQTMNYQELSQYIKKLESQGYMVKPYLVDLYGKVSFCFISLIMVIIGAPVSLRLNRSGGKAIGFGLSIILGFVFWLLLAMSLALGHAGVLPPIIAAWGVNILFGAVGIYLFIKIAK